LIDDDGFALALSIGIGGNHTQELRLFEVWSITSSSVSSSVAGWFAPRTGWSHKVVLEAGLLVALGGHFYVSGTYRVIGFERSSFTIGSGFCIGDAYGSL
jgi:hypothetical protein